MARLAQGELVTNIAGDLGYESVSAFISMFRRMLGTTPARYFDDAGSSGLERSDRRMLARDQDGSEILEGADIGAANVIPLRRS